MENKEGKFNEIILAEVRKDQDLYEASTKKYKNDIIEELSSKKEEILNDVKEKDPPKKSWLKNILKKFWRVFSC